MKSFNQTPVVRIGYLIVYKNIMSVFIDLIQES